MLKLNYEIQALQPVHTGSDENAGITRSLRREKVLLQEPLIIESNFNSENERRNALLEILKQVWVNINKDDMSSTRLMHIYDEFASKLLAATGVRSKQQFLNRICESWGIRSLTDEKIVSIIDRFNDQEFLETIRQEYQYLVLLIRKANQDRKEGKEGQDSIDFGKEKSDSLTFEKYFDNVPYISGNTIRGLMRRLAMRDFCDLAGITGIMKDLYHQLFTGGNLNDSTGFEDIAKREQYRDMCPMIALFGSAIGNMTIEGDLKVGGGRLKCKENGTGDKSYWELIDKTFGTRLDSSKTEDQVDVIGEDANKSSNQMKYEYEVFIVGSRFDSVFALTTEDELIQSAFWRAVRLLKSFGYIAGQSARDSGLVNIDIEIPEGADKVYIDYIEANKQAIYDYFQSTPIKDNEL